MASKILVNGLNIRFVDVPNQRSLRRNWVKELSSRRDYASSFYFTDIRDRSGLLLNIRTVYWLLRNALSKFEVHVVVVFNEEDQISEFRQNISSQTPYLPVRFDDQSSGDAVVEIENKFSEMKNAGAGPQSFHV
jgi:hypothetical protein